MQSGDFNSRIKILRLTKSADGFGGFTSSESTIATVWCNQVEKRGEIEQEGGLRQRKLEIELQFRKKTADQILDSDILQFDGSSEKMRINDRIDSVEDFFTTIKATEI
jgi:hypothetical protein